MKRVVRVFEIVSVDLGDGEVWIQGAYAHRHPDAPQGGQVAGPPPLWVRRAGGAWVCAGRIPWGTVADAVDRIEAMPATEREALVALVRALTEGAT